MVRSKYLILTLLLAVVLISFFSLRPVSAQLTQTTYTVNLNYLTVKVTYPAQVMPGDSVTVSVQASAKNAINAVSLTAQFLYSDGTTLHQLASGTVDSNYLAQGGSMNKQIQFTVPQDAPRTSIVAVVTEKVQTAYTYYNYYYAYSYNYSNPSCYYYPDYYYYYYGYCTYSYSYPYYPYVYANPEYSYSTSTDTGEAPLSYIKATTPEYSSLQSQYQNLQQQLSQSQAQNQQLKQNLQDAQSKVTQQNATIADLNQQLNSSRSMNTTVEGAAGVLGIIAIILGGFATYARRGRVNPQPPPGEAKR